MRYKLSFKLSNNYEGYCNIDAEEIRLLENEEVTINEVLALIFETKSHNFDETVHCIDWYYEEV